MGINKNTVWNSTYVSQITEIQNATVPRDELSSSGNRILPSQLLNKYVVAEGARLKDKALASLHFFSWHTLTFPYVCICTSGLKMYQHLDFNILTCLNLKNVQQIKMYQLHLHVPMLQIWAMFISFWRPAVSVNQSNHAQILHDPIRW